MNGHSNESLESVLWADSTVEEISIDYDAVNILVSESSGIRKTIICEGYIGYQVIGFWDELIVESGSVVFDHPFIVHCLESIHARYKNLLPPTGNITRNKCIWRALQIILIDGTEIVTVCGGTRVIVST